MIDFSSARITALASTWVGNKGRYESFAVPQKPVVPVNDLSEELLLGAFLTPFSKNEEFFYLHGEEGPDDNPVYPMLEGIFNDPAKIELNSGKLTEALYRACENPKVQGGEFFVIYFEDLMADGEPCSGIGLWKVEGYTEYFKTDRTPEMNLVSTASGIASGKPQIAALILNLDSTEGYRVCVLDSVTKKGERSFWKDDFLRLRPIEDNYFQTIHTMTMTAEFISDKAPVQLKLTQVEVLSLLVKAGDYFKDADEFNIESVSTYLFDNEEQQNAFMDFRWNYSKAYALSLENIFTLNTAAQKKMAKLFKAGLKLDKNFVISAKSRLDLVETGYDEEKGLKFLKLYYEYAE